MIIHISKFLLLLLLLMPGRLPCKSSAQPLSLSADSTVRKLQLAIIIPRCCLLTLSHSFLPSRPPTSSLSEFFYFGRGVKKGRASAFCGVSNLNHLAIVFENASEAGVGQTTARGPCGASKGLESGQLNLKKLY